MYSQFPERGIILTPFILKLSERGANTSELVQRIKVEQDNIFAQ